MCFELISVWFDLKDVGILDSSFCCKELRKHYLSFAANYFSKVAEKMFSLTFCRSSKVANIIDWCFKRSIILEYKQLLFLMTIVEKPRER
jgi:hypothetical protein